jgi:hypothetical protein
MLSIVSSHYWNSLNFHLRCNYFGYKIFALYGIIFCCYYLTFSLCFLISPLESQERIAFTNKLYTYTSNILSMLYFAFRIWSLTTLVNFITYVACLPPFCYCFPLSDLILPDPLLEFIYWIHIWSIAFVAFNNIYTLVCFILCVQILFSIDYLCFERHLNS